MSDKDEYEKRMSSWYQRTLLEIGKRQPTRLELWEIAESKLPPEKMQEYYVSILTDLTAAILSVRMGCEISDDDDRVSAQLQEWWDDSFSFDGVAEVMGQRDDFMNTGLGWPDTVNFTGEACICMEWEVIRLRDIIGIELEEFITEDSVREFYEWWRQNFFDRIASEAKIMDTPNCS